MLFEKQREDWSNARELKKLCCDKKEASAKGRQAKLETITIEEFNDLMSDEKIKAYFELKGLPIKDAELFFKMLGTVSQTKEVDVESFIAGCMKMKGFALSVDLLSLGFETKLIGRTQGEFIKDVRDTLNSIQDKLVNMGPSTIPLSI